MPRTIEDPDMEAFETLVTGSEQAAQQLLLEKLAWLLLRPNLSVADQLAVIREYRETRRSLAGGDDLSPLARVAAALKALEGGQDTQLDDGR